MSQLKIREIGSWTVEQCVAVYKSKQYESDGMWSSELVNEWLSEEDINHVYCALAQAYVESLEKTA